MGDLGHVLDQMALAQGGHVTVFDLGWAGVQCTPFGPPFGQAAVQHGHIHLAHQAEGPPDAGGGKQTLTVVDHHLMAIADPDRAHPADELFGRRRHVGQGRTLIRNLINIKKPRAGDVGCGVFRLRVAARVGQIPRGVKNAQVGVLQVGCQPVGGNQRLWVIESGHRTLLRQDHF